MVVHHDRDGVRLFYVNTYDEVSPGCAARHRRRLLRRRPVARLGLVPQGAQGPRHGHRGAGNSGTVLAVLFAPPLAKAYGGRPSTASPACVMAIPLLVMIVFARSRRMPSTTSFKEHVSCLFQKDGWSFNLIYIITFGRLHRSFELPADLLLSSSSGHQGRGRPPDHDWRPDGLGHPRGGRLLRRSHGRASWSCSVVADGGGCGRSAPHGRRPRSR